MNDELLRTYLFPSSSVHAPNYAVEKCDVQLLIKIKQL